MEMGRSMAAMVGLGLMLFWGYMAWTDRQRNDAVAGLIAGLVASCGAVMLVVAVFGEW